MVIVYGVVPMVECLWWKLMVTVYGNLVSAYGGMLWWKHMVIVYIWRVPMVEYYGGKLMVNW